jgi:outer membrane protein TolC
MTMDQAVAIAEHNAFAIRLQASQVEKSKQQIKLAKANLGFQAVAQGVYQKSNSQVEVAVSPGSPPIVVSPLDTKTGTISFSLPIDVSGALHQVVKSAVAGYHASEETLQASINDTRLSARTAFLAVLRAQANVGVAKEALRDSEAQRDLGRKLFAGQQIARVDLTRYEAQVAQSNSDLITAENTLQLSKYALNYAIARPIGAPVDLVDIRDLPPVPGDPDALVQAGQSQRPEIKSYLQQIRSLLATRSADQGGMEPNLNLGVAYSKTLAGSFTSSDPQTVGTLTLNIPLFDSGITKAKVNIDQQNVVQAQINMEQAQLGISQEIRNAVTNVASARTRLENADEQVSLAREVFRLAGIRQQAGEGTYVDVIDAENSLTLALNTQVGARYDYLLAFSQLQRAIGMDKVPSTT